MKHRRIMWLAMLVLAVSSLATAAVVFAGGDGEKTSSGDKVMTRAAEILDLDPAVLVSAIKQAKQELEEERIASIEAELTTLAESGDLSQEEADAKLEATLVGADKTKATKKSWATKEEGGTSE